MNAKKKVLELSMLRLEMNLKGMKSIRLNLG